MSLLLCVQAALSFGQVLSELSCSQQQLLLISKAQ